MSWGLSQLTVHSCSSRFTQFQFQIDSSARHLLRKIFSLFLPSQVTVTEVYRESFTMAGPAARLAALQRHLGAASLEMEPSVQQQQCKAAGATGFARKGIAAAPSVCSARYPLEFLPAPSITAVLVCAGSSSGSGQMQSCPPDLASSWRTLQTVPALPLPLPAGAGGFVARSFHRRRGFAAGLDRRNMTESKCRD